MSWETIVWRPVDALAADGAEALAGLIPLARSAVEEAASALVMQPVAAASVATSDGALGDLPDGFAPALTIELLGTPRRTVWVALDPASGSSLGGVEVPADRLAESLAEALDSVLGEVLGEGLSIRTGPAAPVDPGARLRLFRLVLREAGGSEIAIAAAVEDAVPAELVTHVATLQALGPGAPSASRPGPSRPAGGAEQSGLEPAVRPSAPTPATARDREAGAGQAQVRPVVLEDLPPSSALPVSQNIDLLLGVSLQVTVEIGRTRLAIRDVLSLAPGSIVELDKLAGEKVDVLVNSQPIAQGEVVVVDENFGVRITDVVSRQRRILSADGAA